MNGSCENNVMADRRLPPRGVLRQLLKYEPETGKLFWKERGPEWFKNDGRNGPTRSASIWNSRYAGNEAGAIDPRGYIGVRINGRRYWAHRLIMRMHGVLLPNCDVDHMDGDRSNNRLENLRPCSPSENSRNAKLPSDNTSGACGVRKIGGKWCARSGAGRKSTHLGMFETFEEAVSARLTFNAANGFSERHGKRIAQNDDQILGNWF